MSSSLHASKGNLVEGDIARHLIRLTIPMTWGILAIISGQLINTFFVGLLGTQELAAISFTFPVTYGFFAFTIGFSIATSSVLSRLIGEGKPDVLHRVTTHTLLFSFLVCFTLSIIGYLCSDSIFHALGARDEMMTLIHQYMSVWFIGAVTISMPVVGNAAIRATGDTLSAAIIMTLCAVINAALDPLLIFGLWGFPKMGVQGAAVATVIANTVCMLAGLYIIHRQKKLTDLKYLTDFSEFGNSVRRIIVIALPAGISNIIPSVVNAAITRLLALSGPASVAAFGIATRMEAFVFVILMGLAVGMGPLLGQNFGAGKFDRMRETIRLSLAFNAWWSVGIAVVLGLLARPVAGLFTDDPAVIDTAVLFFWIVPASYLFANVFRAWTSVFNAIGKPQISFVMTIVQMIVLMIPAAYAGQKMAGAAGLFAAIAMVNTVVGIAFHIWSWKRCRSLAPSAG